MNEQINFSKPLAMTYVYSVAAIINAHFQIHEALWKLSEKYFVDIDHGMTQILIIWCIVSFFSIILIELYIQRFVIKDTIHVKSMLKFFPVSFAKQSPGVRNFIGSIIDQQGGIWYFILITFTQIINPYHIN